MSSKEKIMQLKGQGSMTDREVVVRTFENNVTKDGKTRYLDVQLAAEDPQADGQTNLHAVTRRGKDKDGKAVYSNGAPYSMDQVDKIREAAGIRGRFVDPERGEEVLRLKASFMPASTGSGLVINTNKPMSQSDYSANKGTIGKQIEHTKAAAADQRAAREHDAEKAAEVQTEAEGNEIEID